MQYVDQTPTTAATVGSRNTDTRSNPAANINRNPDDSRFRRLDGLPPHHQDTPPHHQGAPPHTQNIYFHSSTTPRRVQQPPLPHQQCLQQPAHSPANYPTIIPPRDPSTARGPPRSRPSSLAPRRKHSIAYSQKSKSSKIKGNSSRKNSKQTQHDHKKDPKVWDRDSCKVAACAGCLVTSLRWLMT